MAKLNYVKPEPVSLKDHPDYNERWVQEKIAEDPSLLGLGDLVVRDKERTQLRAGRLDLLLQDLETNWRCEVEIQLGKTDEAHIIRALEYWDIERKRYPQYEHTAVIVAENITSRFLNVINLFNGHIPLIAIQMNAFKVGESISLVFTTVLDEMTLGLVDEDEEVQEVTDRAYWENRGSKATLSMTDDLMKLINTWDDGLIPKYNKFYVGLARNGQPDNFVIFRPKKEWLRVEPRLERSEDLEAEMEREGLDVMGYDSRWGRYRIKIPKGKIGEHLIYLEKLLKRAQGNVS